eukprot:CAMPEP_0116895300 /NCGR_PEP_ID=MMETSP0467-20121206/4853_1 /TAXON_ID=283647 /ORGANISM="Mesodinium pulex, Strain SPMC105" /LENGTH=65 /DNA_ID=CAMNT_0004565951 /DNA_START=826 /DNA_END=1023 /DNA_ORIENTATION=+
MDFQTHLLERRAEYSANDVDELLCNVPFSLGADSTYNFNKQKDSTMEQDESLRKKLVNHICKNRD